MSTNKYSSLILFLILMHSIGIRAFPYQGFILGVSTVILIFISDIDIDIEELFFFLFFLLVLNFYAFRTIPSIEKFVNLNLVLTISYFYLKKYRFVFERDLFFVSLLISIHGVVSFLLYKAAPSFFSFKTLGDIDYGFFAVFLVTAENFHSGYRASGLCWEPGVFQLLANLCLFIGIKNRVSKPFLVAPFLAVIFSFSTAGFVVLLLNGFYFLYKQKVNLFKLVPVLVLLSLLFYLFNEEILNNFVEKFDGQNTSGLIRARDFWVGAELIFQKPFIGHGLFDLDYLSDKGEILIIDYDYLGSVFMQENGIFAGGYTNGFLLVVASFGVPLSLFSYYSFLRSDVIKCGAYDAIFLFFVFALTTISEPITLTPFYFCFVGSGIRVVLVEYIGRKG